jgi:hypothetical protein
MNNLISRYKSAELAALNIRTDGTMLNTET